MGLSLVEIPPEGILMKMRYALALYCSDLADSRKDFIPIGVLVVNEKDQKYAFKHLENVSAILGEDVITKAVWDSLPEILEQRFEEYRKDPHHDLYKDRTMEYHGFISQVIEEMTQSTISFSDSISVEGTENLEKICINIFQKKVLRALN